MDAVRAFMLIETSHTDVHKLVAELHGIDGVVLAHPLIGPTDVIAYAEAPDLDELEDLVRARVARLVDSGSATRVETLVVLMTASRSYSREYRIPSTVSAWVFARTRSGSPYRTIAALEGVRGVVHAHAVLGSLDIVAYVEVGSLSELLRIVDSEIDAMPDIAHADTRLVLSPYTLQPN